MPSEARKKFVISSWDIERIFEIHEVISGAGPGRRHRLEVLNKSAFVLICSIWEAYIEDLSTEALSSILKHCRKADSFPNKPKALAGTPLRESKDARDVWKLAGSGWKSVLLKHTKDLISSFHTPSPGKTDRLIECTTGLKKLSDGWKWSGMTADRARQRLTEYVVMRGAIAHGAKTKKPVTKTLAEKYLTLVYGLVSASDNRMRDHVKTVTGKYPWDKEK